MNSAKIQPFFKKYNLNLKVYNVKQKTILPPSVVKRNICLIMHNNIFCVIRKRNRSTFPDAIKELEENFRYEDNQIYGTFFFEKAEEYKIPTSNVKNCRFAVFAFDLETCNVENDINCEAYAAIVYHVNRLNEGFNGELTENKLRIDRKNVHVLIEKRGSMF